MILCACSECIKNSPVDSNGQLQNGRYISSRTHLEHQVADLKKQHSFVERFSLQNQEPSYEQSESEALVLPSTSETTHNDELPAYMNTTLPDMAQLFLSWLHLHGSLSMETCKTARNFLLKVINKAQTTSHEAPLESIIPKDIRTILKHQVNIQIQQTVCCPTCFSLYDPPNLPDRCPYRQTTKGRPCNAPLFEVKKLFPGSSHQGKMQATRSRLRPKQFPTISLPCSVFYSQNFKSWITWFLSLKDIESAIEDWAQELQQNPTDTLTDIQQGTACRGEPAAGPNKRQRLDQNLDDNTAVFFPDRNNEEEEDDHSDIELNQGPEAQDGFSDLTDSNKKVNEQSEPRGRAVIMDNDLYEQLLAYMQVTIPEVRHHQSLPHPIDACILQPDVLFQSTHLCNHTIRVSVASPNNCICFKVQQNIEYGFIHDIIRVTLPGHQSFNLLRIERIENRFCKGARQGSSVFRYWLYQMKTVIGQVFPGRYDFIPTSAVQSIVAYRRLPNNTYGLNSGGVMMVPVNHLSVLQINSSNNLAEGH
ncbi:hypothetical protein MJO28_013447 [Puccinia striiformis f. sp. tritici]|uniref:Uncharacterized protein n=1 Tax=Puccinia striiformis f. sp. tritici TaxID=168172 RepID=A0ACC0DYC4_9BASI|nr:hypothetical protein MJO28_013447 [Puccinia striiformis f. sp. tritici]